MGNYLQFHSRRWEDTHQWQRDEKKKKTSLAKIFLWLYSREKQSLYVGEEGAVTNSSSVADETQ